MPKKREMTPERLAQLRANLDRAREAKRKKPVDNLVPSRDTRTDPAAAASEQDAADRELLSAPIEAADPVEDTAAAERRERLLQNVPPEIAVLITDAELDALEDKERTAASAERKKKALDQVQAQIRHYARVEHSLISADTLRSQAERDRLREPVKFRVRLPRDGAGDARNAGFRVDGNVYQEGTVYTVPRAVFESLRETHYRAWLNELKFRTLDQHKPGGSAVEIIGESMPRLEVA